MCQLNDIQNLQKQNLMVKIDISNFYEDQNKFYKVNQKKNKKKIGNYSYHLNKIIGKGFSSFVYKGIKNNDKNQFFAIKVIKITNISKKIYQMLQTQIAILSKLSHPNILKFHEVFYTKNHCYIITQFCEGGSLQQHIEKHYEQLELSDIIQQVGSGCQQLAHKLIVHRDIKPANIFLKNGVWKIGDFGFSCIIDKKNEIIQGTSTIGSPLYMPPEALSHNIYSLKTDSFAFGILIYYLLKKQYPWYGNNRKSLLREYSKSKLDLSKFKNFSKSIIQILENLCKLKMEERMLVTQCDFSYFHSIKSIQKIKQGILTLRQHIPQQVTLCQFINYLLKNCQKLLTHQHKFVVLISNHLNYLTEILQWNKCTSLRDLKVSHPVKTQKIEMELNDYQQILNVSYLTVQHFLCKQQTRPVAIKIMEYIQLLQVMLHHNIVEFLEVISTLQLHENFTVLLPNQQKLKQLFDIIQKYR